MTPPFWDIMINCVLEFFFSLEQLLQYNIINSSQRSSPTPQGLTFAETLYHMEYSYKNRPPLGFDELGGEADQTLELSRESPDAMEYPLK